MKRIGVIGTGAISDIFFDNMINRFKNLEVVGCSSRDPEHYRAKAEKYGIKPYSLDELFADSSIDILVNLTPAPVHYELIKRGLNAGKHIYTEKPLALNYNQAKELLDLATANGLRLGTAPDTFLGAGVQTAARAVKHGKIDEVTGFIVMLNRGLELLYEVFGFLQQPGGGIGYDFGVYALTAVFSILGSAAEVCGFSQTNRPTREYKFLPQFRGQPYTVENENVMVAAIKMKSGVLGTVTFNGDSVFPEKPYL
jgi:predicted dehydrogenase